MIDYELKLDPLAVLDLLKLMNFSDHEKGPHRSLKSISNGLEFFTNFLQTSIIKRVKTDPLAILDILERIDSLTLEIEVHENKEK